MHIANVKVPSQWVKLEDLLSVGRNEFKISPSEIYYIHNGSGYTLYLAEASSIPGEDAEEIKIYAGKSAGYVKDVADLYVCSKLPEDYSYPEYLSITVSNDVCAEGAIPVGDYRPDSAFRGAYVYRGTVETLADLPQDAGVGDVYEVKAEGDSNFAWNGQSWDDIGGIEDLSAYALKEEIPTKVSQLENDKLYVIPEELTEALAPKAEAADVVALEAKVDANMEEVGNVIAANVAALEDAIDLKADKTQLEPLATKDEAEALGIRIDENVAKIETKADKTVVEALEVKVDGNHVALEKELGNAKAELEAGLELKADKTELEPLATKVELQEAIAAVDHSTYATKEEVIELDNNLRNELGQFNAELNNRVDDLAQLHNEDKAELQSELNLKAGRNELQAGLEVKADKDQLEILATKAELEEAIAAVDHSTYATKEDLEQAIASVDHSTFATKEEVNAKDAELEEGLTNLAGSKADKAELNPLATKDEVQAGLKKKVEATIESADGQAKIFNETSGGGAQFVNTKKNTLSFVGVNNGNDGVFVQIYSKDKASNIGARLNASPDGIYYTNGKTNGSYEDADEIVTKADLQEAIAGVDHSTFVSKEDLKEGLAGKTEALIEGPNGKARIFNETSGGGAQFANTVKNTLSYVGVNDGNDGVFVQIYSKDSKTNVGARLNAAPTGIYYTNGKTNGSYEEGNEIVTKADLQEVADKADKAGIEASMASVLARMNVLEERISDINKTDVEAVVIEGEVPSMNDETKDYVVKGNITAPATISGKSITLKDAQINNLAKVVGTAQGDVDVKAMAIQGEYPVNPSNVILDFAADGYVTIKDTAFDVNTYNAINIGLRQPAPKGVLIDGVDFRGKCRNNAISVYSTQENAVININNCYFEDVSNAIRICNSTNTSCTVNITNCRCDKWEERLQYAGLMIFEDIVSKTAEEADENNFFGNGKVVVNISNFILPNGEKLTAQDLAGICGTQDENQVFYTFAKAVRPYSEEFYPVINIL